MGRCLDAPLCSYVAICLYTPVHLYTPRGLHTPTCPPYSCVSVCSEASACCGGVVRGPLTCWKPPLHLPCMGVPPLQLTPPTLISFPVHWYVSGISMSYGHFSLKLVVWGCPPSVGGLWGHQHMGCPFAHSCNFCSLLCLMYLLWL